MIHIVLLIIFFVATFAGKKEEPARSLLFHEERSLATPLYGIKAHSLFFIKSNIVARAIKRANNQLNTAQPFNNERSLFNPQPRIMIRGQVIVIRKLIYEGARVD